MKTIVSFFSAINAKEAKRFRRKVADNMEAISKMDIGTHVADDEDEWGHSNAQIDAIRKECEINKK